ncbi:MAG: tRNA1(Val) (adenine(37)-N6)-methyltransferase [Nitrospiraceae bacterium]|nr:MAG: tRNA1(Val) (adenine(37)-N6)-methyltransferase [Nitrospiraceae bacterium]
MSFIKSMKQLPEETLDSIRDIKIIQAKDGYRFSIDAVLLENYISAKRLHKGVELGAGSGIISILLASRLKGPKIIAVEVQGPLAERARRNVSLNNLDDRIEIVANDMRALKKMFPANTFDFVFSNPPFRKPKTGRLSIYEERAVARHEIEITLPDLIKTASYLLKHSGRFYLIYHPFRLAELVELLRKARLEPKRMRFVHSKEGDEAKMVLIEAVKGSGTWLKIDPPLYLYEKGNEYTLEMKAILNR